MNHVCLFLNTEIEGSGALAGIGNFGLTPFRYLFSGQTIRIEPAVGSPELSIHHVASFHKDGHFHGSKTHWDLRSAPTHKILALISVVLLIPGLVLSAFKLLAYTFADVRQRHRLAKEHFTPINKEIGSVAHPVATIADLRAALVEARANPKNQPINALIIHGDGQLAINEDPGILPLNPMKLILEGARIVHRPSAIGRLDDDMASAGKWQVAPVRRVTSANVDVSPVEDQRVSSIEEALAVQAPRRPSSSKRYHQVFTLARPAQS